MQPREVAASIGLEAQRLATSWQDGPKQIGTERQCGMIGDGTQDEFTVAGMGCFAVHEAHHQLLDANGGFEEK
jgi:hypothetical protein